MATDRRKKSRGKPAPSRTRSSRKSAAPRGGSRGTTRARSSGGRGAGGKKRQHERGDDAQARGRAFWSGTLTFGLVSVPVDLFPALRSGGLPLRMLAEDGTPLRRRFYCPHDDTEVPRDRLVRGYELEDGSHVVVTDKELEALAPGRSRDIDLRRFVARDEIDPAYFQRAYFLTPAGDSTKPYRLLAEVMERTGRAGIATFVMRGKEYLVAILAEDGILRAETMRFFDELRSPEDLGLDERVDAPAKRVSAMEKAVRARATDELDPKLLVDEQTELLRALVQEKAKRGQDVVDAPVSEDTRAERDAGDAEEDEELATPDLVETIRRSLRAARDGKGRGDGRAARTRGGRVSDFADLSRVELYERAKARDVPGRSGMTKGELMRALRRRR